MTPLVRQLIAQVPAWECEDLLQIGNPHADFNDAVMAQSIFAC